MKKKTITQKKIKPSKDTLPRIAALCEAGWAVKAIAIGLCIALTTAYFWVNRFNAAPAVELAYRKRGRKPGSGRLLDPNQEAEIQDIIKNSLPAKHGLNFSTWTRRSISQLIYDIYKIKIADRTVGDYLQRWNMTPQKPTKRAIQRNEEKVQEWCDETYPEIVARAESEDAVIFWADESSANTHDNNQRSYAPKGETPVVEVSGTKFKKNIIAAISLTGIMRYMTLNVGINSVLFIEFMKRLIDGCIGQKIFLVVDNLKVHHSKLVQQWLAENSHRIEIFYIPPYAPDLNPVEYLNNIYKQRFRNLRQPASQIECDSLIGKILKKLQRSPDTIKSCFQKKEVSYTIQ
jgi:transposase